MDGNDARTGRNAKHRMNIRSVPILIRVALLGSLGGIFFVAGLTLWFVWSTFFISVMHNQLRVIPGSETYQLWRDTPVPQYMNFYFFNWTNHEKLDTEKPILQELGPYRFSIIEKKTDIVHNENGTLTYRVKRFWHFDEENSNGSVNDEIVTLNAVAKTAAHSIKNWNGFMRRSLSMTMGAYSTQIHIKKTVGELLFDGYSDPLLETASKLPAFSGLSVPFDKFGWFYLRNGSTEFDGLFNMDTGENGIDSLGVLKRWNNENRTGFYEGSCNMLNGSAGELFPPQVDRTRGLQMFSPDLCRSIKLSYVEDVESYGLTGYKFAGDEYTFDNGTLDPANGCFCNGDCSPSGVLNVTTCRYGAPGFVSFPHFHLGDQYYRDQVEGMVPNPVRHTLYITLEPTFGIPLDVAARFQINILLSPDDVISLFNDVPTIYFPMIWFEHRASITPELASQVRLALEAPSWNAYVGGVNMLLGAVLIAWAAYICYKNRRRNNKIPTKEELKIGSLQNSYSNGKTTKEIESLLTSDK